MPRGGRVIYAHNISKRLLEYFFISRVWVYGGHGSHGSGAKTIISPSNLFGDIIILL